jgi:tryptophan-rich sensory protein
VAAGVGGLATGSGLEWYRTLDRPPWSPPDAAFGPVWSLLYAGQAVAAWLVWRADHRRPGDLAAEPALTLYGGQLLLNLAWPVLFFGLRKPGLALVEIAVLWVAIAATVRSFAVRHKLAAAMLVPYLLWVGYAAALTADLWRRNR